MELYKPIQQWLQVGKEVIKDRVSIIYNIPKHQGYSDNKNKTPWPNCSFFGLYDGHGEMPHAIFWEII